MWHGLLSIHSFVRELHQQLVSCMNHFNEALQKYQSDQEEKIKSRDVALHREMSEAQQVIADIGWLLTSREATDVNRMDMIRRCTSFFTNCVDFAHTDDDFAYLDFVRAGRLYVRSEHLGYLRLCNAAPEFVSLTLAEGTQTMCHRECTVLIQTDHRDCVNAEPHLDVRLTDDSGLAVTFKTVNNSNGSYGVVFTPDRPGTHRLHVQLFGISVEGSPLEISVENEAVDKASQSTAAALNDSSRTHTQLTTRPSVTSTQLATPTSSSEDNRSNNAVPLNCRSRSQLSGRRLDTSHGQLASPGVSSEVFDDSEYFRAPLSPHSVAESSPGGATASAGGAMASGGCATANAESATTSAFGHRASRDHNDWEEVDRSMKQMAIHPATSVADNTAGGWPSSAHRTHVGGNSTARRGSVPSYAHGQVLEFEDLVYEENEDFDSSG